MTRQIDLTDSQLRATRRADQDGSVYILSGTLRGRGATPDVQFAWATHTFSGTLGAFDGYIRKPAQVLRGQEYLPGNGSTFPGIAIPIRNYPFNERDSLLALIDDGDFAWENSEADLRVAYLLPGQRTEDVPAEDWTFLVSGGVFGPPSNIEIDGFTATLYHRGARREQSFRHPQMPSVEEARFIPSGLLADDVFRAFDRKDMGAPMPLVVGKPNSWYRALSLRTGVRGFTVSGYAAGTVSGIQFQAITDGASRLSEEADLPTPNRHKVRILYRTPVYDIVSGSATYDEDTQVYTITLTSGLATDIPRGSLLQEMIYGNTNDDGYKWLVAGHHSVNGLIFPTDALRDHVGWLLPDGTIRPADLSVWPWLLGGEFLTEFQSVGEAVSGLSRVVTALQLRVDGATASGTLARVPCYFDPASSEVSVSQQPTFDQELRLDAKPNYPSGGTGTNNQDARDGNDQTGVSLPTSTVITLTFNSEASGDFADGDTVSSVLHIIGYGHVIFTDSGGGTNFATIDTGGAVRQEFRFQQATARDFNATVRCEGGSNGGGGVVFEVWWEHDLITTKASTRTADVELSGGAAVGEKMQYADLVFRWPHVSGAADLGAAGNVLRWHATGGNGPDGGEYTAGLSSIRHTFRDVEVVSGISGAIPTPTACMPFIQSYFLGTDISGTVPPAVSGEGFLGLVNSGVYRVANDRFLASGIRWNFVITERMNTWQQVEAELALQSQSHMYYGPTGHEVVFREGIDLAASGVVQEFRLPGVPGCNTDRAGGPLLERMLASEVINTATARWNPDHVGGELLSLTEAENAESVALFGPKRDPQAPGGAYDFWAHSPWEDHPTYDADLVLSGMMSFYAGEAAFARTRFLFKTSWIAHGVERGSPVRVVYEVAPGVYRNVACEVEQITVDPVNGDSFGIKCRALDLPTPGLPALTWEDLFTALTDVWTDYIATGETWKNNWSI